MKTIMIPILLGILLGSCTSQHAEGQVFAEEKTTPFEAIKWVEEKPRLKVEGQWFELISMRSFTGEYLLNNCKIIYPSNWKKRFGEDFVEFLWKLDIKPQIFENFTLKAADGQLVEKELEFTHSKRNLVYRYFRQHYDKEEEFNFSRKLNQEELVADLRFLKQKLLDHYSYADLRGVDTDYEIEKMIQCLPEEISVREFGILIQELMVKYGDGHSRVRNLELESFGVLPFKTRSYKGKVICYLEDKLIHEKYPFLHAVNGLESEDLLALAKKYQIAAGSEQFVQYHSAKALGYMGFLLSRKNKYSKDLEVILTNESGERFKTEYSLRFKPGKSKFDKQKELMKLATEAIQYQELEGKIAYLRIKNMFSFNPDEEFKRIMEQAKNSRGMIIDVRNNGGGGRMISNSLIPYFIKEGQNPLIASLAKFRTDVKELPREGVLDNRFMFPKTSSKFSEAEKTKLEDFQKNFQTEWNYNQDQYSDWHYYVIRQDLKKKRYTQAVVVLMDEACFSATDIFLGAFKQLDHITLMGTKSGGGSGRVIDYQLPNSRYRLALSSIISFQADGRLYDGNGIEPDIQIKQNRISDILGQTDTQLEHALDYLKQKK